MSAHPSSRSSLVLVWIGVAYGVACLVLGVVAIVRLSTGTADITDAIWAVALVLGLVLLAYPVLFSRYRVAADRRMRRAEAAHPGAHLLEIVARPETAAQLKQLARAFGVPVGRLPWNNYAVFVADEAALRLWAGTFDISERVALPTSALVGVTPLQRSMGLRTVTVLRLSFQDAGGTVWPLELVPMRWSGALMRVLPAESFPAELAAMQRATHPHLTA